jgi:hypothetical protein
MSKENYTFLFKDGYYVTFPLTKEEFKSLQQHVYNKLDVFSTEDFFIMLTDVRYVAKQEQIDEVLDSAVPEFMEQEVYEYIKQLERGMRNGETE